MDDGTVPSGENNALGLSGLILGLVALICALFPAWRVLAMILSGISIITSIVSLSRAHKTHSKRIRAWSGVALAVVALALSIGLRMMNQSDPDQPGSASGATGTR